MEEQPASRERSDSSPSLASVNLLRLWQHENDLQALEALIRIEVANLKGRIRRESKGMLSASASASDIAQEAVYRLLRQEEAPNFKSPAALRHYLWKAAWRLLIDRLRRSSRKTLLPEEALEFEQAMTTNAGLRKVENDDRRTALLFVVNLLPEHDREVIELVHFQGHSIDEAAARLDISQDAARMRLVRARKNLARKLRHWTEVIG